MDTERLRLLVELSRLGSMAEVAAETGRTTSAVSQGIAALSRQVGAPMVEPHGRRVRLTPAGRRLAERAVAILAAVEAARADLDPGSEPVGQVRVAGFATAVRRSVLPAVRDLSRSHPHVDIRVQEREPLEALELLAHDDVDLVLVYDYDLAPATWREDLSVRALWTAGWGLGLPAAGTSARLADHADADWIVNSRHTADEAALRTMASIAGFVPRIVHRIDSLDLVDDLIASGHGLALLPLARAGHAGVAVRPIDGQPLTLRAYAVTRAGHDAWAPLRLLLDRLASRSVHVRHAE